MRKQLGRVPINGVDVTTVDFVGEAPGHKGDSAYQVAVTNGFVGTEQEWLATLEGPPGPGSPFLVLTQEEYDALPVKDPDTVYICVPHL